MPTERDEILEGTKPVKFSNHKIKKKKKKRCRGRSIIVFRVLLLKSAGKTKRTNLITNLIVWFGF